MAPTPETCPLDLKAKIKILNPAKPGLAMIGVKHALRYVRRGEAEFVQSGQLVGLRFTDDRDRFRATLAAASATGYDRAGMRTVAEIKRLPVAGNVVLGITRQTKRSAPSPVIAPPVEHNRPGRYAQVAGRNVKADGWWCSCQPTPPQS